MAHYSHFNIYRGTECTKSNPIKHGDYIKKYYVKFGSLPRGFDTNTFNYVKNDIFEIEYGLATFIKI